MDENAPSMHMENNEILYSDSAIVRFKLTSPLMLQYDQDPKDQYLEFPNGIHIERYDSNMEIITKITADYARQFTKDQRWLARNNVVVVNNVGDTLKTEELYWDQKYENIYTDKFVTIVRQDRIINGIGMKSDQAINNWVINNISGIMYLQVEE